MYLTFVTILLSALHRADAFQKTGSECVTCYQNPNADTCSDVLASLYDAGDTLPGGSNINVDVATGDGFCCGQTTSSCSSFAAAFGLKNEAESCDAACVSAFSKSGPSSPSTSGSPAASPGTTFNGNTYTGNPQTCTNCTVQFIPHAPPATPGAPETAPSPPSRGSTPPTSNSRGKLAVSMYI